MDEEYDVIVCGTGFKESILSGLMGIHGKKVLHLDRNAYYGGESASLNITQLWEKFKPGEKVPECYGKNRDWNVDLIPKFVMATGGLVKMLLGTGVHRYLEWKVVDGTFVYQYQKAGLMSSEKFIHKVPATDMEALKSPLMSLLEKNRAKNFFQFIMNWKKGNPSTYQGVDPNQHTMAQVYQKFGLCQSTIDYLGHAVALYEHDDYLQKPCGEAIDKCKLYIGSVSAYGSSPFIYPLYGLGGIPEGFARLSAIHGGTYMLNKQVDGFVYGKVCGVRSGDEVARAPIVICSPTYADPSKIRASKRVVRAICILGAPIPNTNNVDSCQIIIPARSLKEKTGVQRHNDIYVACVSSAHCVSMQGKYVAMVSTIVETQNPVQEIRPAIDLLGKPETHFIYLSDIWEPADDGHKDNVFVTASYDSTSHFEQATDEVYQMWQNITGKPLDLTEFIKKQEAMG